MILLTGFRPFLDQKINPSEEILKSFSNRKNITTLVLPVEFNKAFDCLEKELQKKKYKSVLMLGQAGGRSKVSLEKFALNYVEEFPDEAGVKFKAGPIDPRLPLCFQTPFPVEKWCQDLNKKKLPVAVSLSAGGFICNEISYRLAHKISTEKLKIKWLFIHFPFLKKQTLKNKKPFLAKSKMIRVTDFVLNKTSSLVKIKN